MPTTPLPSSPSPPARSPKPPSPESKPSPPREASAASPSDPKEPSFHVWMHPLGQPEDRRRSNVMQARGKVIVRGREGHANSEVWFGKMQRSSSRRNSGRRHATLWKGGTSVIEDHQAHLKIKQKGMNYRLRGGRGGVKTIHLIHDYKLGVVTRNDTPCSPWSN